MVGHEVSSGGGGWRAAGREDGGGSGSGNVEWPNVHGCRGPLAADSAG